MLVSDGNVVMLGGLLENGSGAVSQKVPGLSNLPVLGRLFRNDGTSLTKTNLLIFIRPTIIRDDEQLAGASAEKYRYSKHCM